MNGKLNNMEELKKRLQTAIMMKRQQVAIANQTISITPSIWPAKGVVSSPYGLRWGGSDFHPGIDIAMIWEHQSEQQLMALSALLVGILADMAIW